jgi:Phospholipase_D-nuclease N-terminal
MFFLVVGIGGLVLFIWALVDVVRMPNDASFKSGTQLIWVLVVVLAQGIGALIYFIVGRPPGGATGARVRVAANPPTLPPPPA